MKTFIIFLFLICFANLEAQDKYPSPFPFVWGFSTTPRPFDVDSFQQKTVLTGFHWSGEPRMSNAVLNNTCFQGGIGDSTNRYKMNIINYPSWWASTDYWPANFGAIFMEYEPTLPLDSFS